VAAVGETALRVKLLALHHVDPVYTGGASVPFILFEGQSMYVGPPLQYVESVSSVRLFTPRSCSARRTTRIGVR